MGVAGYGGSSVWGSRVWGQQCMGQQGMGAAVYRCSSVWEQWCMGAAVYWGSRVWGQQGMGAVVYGGGSSCICVSTFSGHRSFSEEQSHPSVPSSAL